MPELQNEISPDDILYILEHPWKITESEWGLQDKAVLETKLPFILKYLKLSAEDGYSRIWKTPDEEPIALLAGYKVEDRKYETLFIASTHMEVYTLKLSFEMRKILKDKSASYKGCTLRIYSTSDHPQQITWFRFLGFKYMPEGNIGATRYFEYSSPSE
jgi:hypothetical protein